MIAPALAAGGHLHVGIEFYRGDREPSTETLVREAAAAATAAGRPIASCAPAAEILGLRR